MLPFPQSSTLRSLLQSWRERGAASTLHQSHERLREHRGGAWEEMVQCTHEVLEEACAAEEPPGEERLTILLWQAWIQAELPQLTLRRLLVGSPQPRLQLQHPVVSRGWQDQLMRLQQSYTRLIADGQGALYLGAQNGALSCRSSQDGSLRWTQPQAHRGAIEALEIHPSGALYSIGRDGLLKIWSADSGTLEEELPPIQSAWQGLRWLRDRDSLLIWDTLGKVHLFEGGSHRETLTGPRGRLIDLDVMEDRIVAAEPVGRVWLWENGRREARLLSRVGEPLSAVMLSRFKDQLILGYDSGRLESWSIQKRRWVNILKGHTQRISQLRRWGDSAMVSASLDRTLRTWDLESGRGLGMGRGHQRGVLSMELSGEGDRCWTLGMDRSARAWDLGNLRVARPLLRHLSSIRSCRVLPGGKEGLSGSRDGRIFRWDLHEGEPSQVFRGHQGALYDLALAPSGQRLASASTDNSLRVWDLQEGETVGVFEHEAPVTCCVFVDDDHVLSGGRDGLVQLWRVDSPAPLQCWRGHEHWVRCLRYDPQRRRIYSGSYDHRVCVWQQGESEPLQTLQDHEAQVIQMSLSPRGDLLATGDLLGGILIWSLDDMRVLRRLRLPDKLSALCWLSSTSLLAGGLGMNLHRWEWSGSEEAAHQIHPLGVTIDSLDSLDGRLLVGDRQGELWIFSV